MAPENLSQVRIFWAGLSSSLAKLALLAVVVIASQIHPAAVILAVACVLLIVYGRTLFRRLALFAGYFLCGFVLFIGFGLITTLPLEKEYPLLAKAVAVVLFVVLCLVIPALLSMRPRQEIIAGSGSWASGDGHLKTPTLTFADVGGLEECKKQIRDLVQANLNGKKFGEYGVFRNGILLYGPRGTGKTFLAEAVAGEFKLKYCCVSAASLHHKYVGETESHIETLFLRSDLIRALAENPAPTVPALCRRLGISTSRVYCLHGDLARAIAARHLRERAESMERWRELLRTDVFAIVKNMLDRGEPPIQARVRRMLSADSLKAGKRSAGF